MENALSPTRYIPPTTFVALLQQLQTTEHTRIVLLAKQPAPYAFPPALALTCVRECVRAKRTKAARCRSTGEFPSTASDGVDEVITAYIERIPCEEFLSLDNFLLAN